MDKESSQKIAKVLSDASVALLSVTAERDKLASRVKHYETREEATKVACLMHDKGINLDMELPELVAHLEKEASAGRLGEIARAAEMIGPSMSFGSPNQGGPAVDSGDAFTSYLVGNVG